MNGLSVFGLVMPSNLTLVLAGILLTALSGLMSLACVGRPRLATVLFTSLMLLGSAFGILGAIGCFVSGTSIARLGSLAPPVGAIDLRLDGVASFFVFQVFLIGALGAIYQLGYCASAKARASVARLRVFYGLTVAGMGAVTIANNLVAFLMAWEVMALAAFMALTHEDERAEVKKSGMVYLVATRLGSLALLVMVALLLTVTQSTRFPVASLSAHTPVGLAVFLLGLVGFGLKAGLMPLHVWLPGAHANAPSHVSALMSGVLIKMGIYGLIRLGAAYRDLPVSAGIAVFWLGALSAVLGVIFAIAQHDLKRLLAYHSVENIGIILMGLGLALVGRASGRPELLVLGLSGALLHTVNHGLFKALLFLGAGSVILSGKTREIDRMGGLAKRMPVTMLTFLIGAAAIAGLPPLNGFVSEFLIYLGMLRGGASMSGNAALLVILGVPTLALVGALAVACFTKVVGVVFLGEPRTEQARDARECPATMWWPMVGLALSCVVIGLGPRWLSGPLHRACLDFGLSSTALAEASLPRLVPFKSLAAVNGLLIVGIGLGLGVIGWLAPRARRKAVPTWDCGYAAVTPRMQYTASSFAEMLVRFFASVLRPQRKEPDLAPVFLGATRFSTHVPEVVLDLMVLPVLRQLTRARSWFLWLQTGSVQLYVLFVLAALVVMLAIWR